MQYLSGLLQKVGSMRVRSVILLIGSALSGFPLVSAWSAAERTRPVMRLSVNQADLRLGEYSCIGSGGTILIGLGFRVLPGRKYVSLDNKDGGSYAYDTGSATITFIGGFLEGFKGEDVRNNQFRIHGASCGPA